MNPVIGLSLGRVAVGVVALTQPDRAASMLGLDARTNPQAPYLTRMFGSREIALGAATLLARGTARRNLIVAGLGVDLADAATGVQGARDGSVSAKSAAMLVGPALLAVLNGLAGLRARR